MLKKRKRRYLAIQIDSKERVNSKEFMYSVWDTLIQLFGEYGASRSGLALINYDALKEVAILRCWHDATEMIRTVIASITTITETPVVLHILTCSGTLKALRKKISPLLTENLI